MNSNNASVRPKIRAKHSEKLIGEPLEKRSIRFEDRDGIQRYYPAMHIRFSHSMVFIKYTIPPIETIADLHFNGNNVEDSDQIKKWIANVHKYEEMLKILLGLQHNQFWSTLIYEKSLQISLESYLRLAPRPHDFHNFMITDQMKIAVKKVHNLIFKLFLRISSSAESKTNFITPETFGAIIYDNYLFDIPKMIDLSVLYANTDYQPLLMRMFSNVIQCQPRYLEDMNKGCANFVEALNLIEEKLGLNENQFGNNSKLKYLQFPELQNIISNLTDISVSLRVLLISMPQFANNYKTASIERIIIEFYNKVFPPLQKELNYRFESIENSDLIANGIKHQILIARSNLVQTFRDIIKICFFDQLFNQSLTTDPKLSIMNELIETLTLASYEKSFITDYCRQYPVDKDFEWLSQHSDVTRFKCVDEAPINYLKSIIESSISDDKPKSVQILVDKSEPKVNGFTNVEELNNTDIDIELESQIQYIREIIPDLGPGFVQKCLEYFNLDNEKVLNAILEDNLPPELSNIDRNLQKVPKIEKENEVKNDNSLAQSTSTETQIPKIIDERHNIYNNDEFDIYRNKNIDLSRIHRGKKDKITPKLDAMTKEKIIAIHNKSLEDEENDDFSNYNDEYDDTYEDDTKVDLISDKLLDELVSQQSAKVYSNDSNGSYNNDNNENKQNYNPRKSRHNY